MSVDEVCPEPGYALAGWRVLDAGETFWTAPYHMAWTNDPPQPLSKEAAEGVLAYLKSRSETGRLVPVWRKEDKHSAGPWQVGVVDVNTWTRWHEPENFFVEVIWGRDPGKFRVHFHGDNTEKDTLHSTIIEALYTADMAASTRGVALTGGLPPEIFTPVYKHLWRWATQMT